MQIFSNARAELWKLPEIRRIIHQGGSEFFAGISGILRLNVHYGNVDTGYVENSSLREGSGLSSVGLASVLRYGNRNRRVGGESSWRGDSILESEAQSVVVIRAGSIEIPDHPIARMHVCLLPLARSRTDGVHLGGGKFEREIRSEETPGVSSGKLLLEWQIRGISNARPTAAGHIAVRLERGYAAGSIRIDPIRSVARSSGIRFSGRGVKISGTRRRIRSIRPISSGNVVSNEI